MNDVWVVAEHSNCQVKESTLEILGDGRQLARSLNGKLVAILLGKETGQVTNILGHYGAQEVYLVENSLLQEYTTEAYTIAVVSLIRMFMPAAVIFSATPDGRDLAPRVAARLGLGVASGCVSMKLNQDGILEATRPIYDDQVYETLVFSATKPWIITVLPGVIGIDKPDSSQVPEVTRPEVKLSLEDIRTKVTGSFKADPKALPLPEAELLVSGGAGIGEIANWHLIEDLAEVLGASVAGSRMAMDLGWIPRERLVGQSGNSVSPRLYVAVGISGATQHLMAVNAKKMIAINTDHNAKVFESADLKVIASAHDLIPILVQKIRQTGQAIRIGD